MDEAQNQAEIAQVREWAATADSRAAVIDDPMAQDYHLAMAEAYRNVLHLIDPDHECEDCDE